jgi:hypothetical protein
MAKKTTARATKRSTRATAGARKRSTLKRETIDTGKTKMYGKRTTGGRFKQMDDVGRSLSVDRRRKAKTAVKAGYGDQGDRKVAPRSGKKR